MQDYAIGVDLGGTNLRVAAIDAHGKLLHKITTSTKMSGGRHQIVDAMCDAIKTVVKQFHSSYHLIGTGLGVPGIIDLESGTVLNSPNLREWNGFAAGPEIRSKLGMPAVLDNDANVAALGECRSGWNMIRVSAVPMARDGST